MSKGFDDFRITEGWMRGKAESFSEPISVFTNVVQHCSVPSPSCSVDRQKVINYHIFMAK